MKITGIEQKKSSMYTIYVDEEYFYILNIEIISDFHLKVGMEVDEEFLQKLKDAADQRKARERAFYLIGYRAHSQKELYDKLRKSYSDELSAQTVAKMIDMGYLNDEEYASGLAESYLLSKKWSKRKALYQMQTKGIDKEMALAALDELEVDPVAQITELIDQKYYRRLGDFKENQKVIAALARLGFGYSDIKKAINEYGIDEEEEYYGD